MLGLHCRMAFFLAELFVRKFYCPFRWEQTQVDCFFVVCSSAQWQRSGKNSQRISLFTFYDAFYIEFWLHKSRTENQLAKFIIRQNCPTDFLISFPSYNRSCLEFHWRDNIDWISTSKCQTDHVMLHKKVKLLNRISKRFSWK